MYRRVVTLSPHSHLDEDDVGHLLGHLDEDGSNALARAAPRGGEVDGDELAAGVFERGLELLHGGEEAHGWRDPAFLKVTTAFSAEQRRADLGSRTRRVRPGTSSCART